LISAPTADPTPDEPSRRKCLARAGPGGPEAAACRERERERAALIADERRAQIAMGVKVIMTPPVYFISDSLYKM
jgi:hypothetical protein